MSELYGQIASLGLRFGWPYSTGASLSLQPSDSSR